jgi:hypothetical protein
MGKDMTMTKTALSQEFQEYNRTMAKLNVYGSTLDALNSGYYVITLTTRTWNLGGRKSFSRSPQSVEKSKITARQYACCVTSVGFVPVQLTCTSPDRATKIERTFSITHDTPPWD